MDQAPISKSVRNFALVAMLGFGAYFAWTMAHTTFYSSGSISDLEKEFGAVEHPKGAARTEPATVASKVTFQVVAATYVADTSATELKRQLAASLASRGWINKADPRSSGQYAKFCKNDLDAVVEVTSENAQRTRYYFGISRQQGPRVASGCV